MLGYQHVLFERGDLAIVQRLLAAIRSFGPWREHFDDQLGINEKDFVEVVLWTARNGDIGIVEDFISFDRKTNLDGFYVRPAGPPPRT